MELKVYRQIFREESTIGNFLINDKFQCFTLEDKTRDENEPKVYGRTAIPVGRYEITLRTEGTIHAAYLERFGSDFHKGTLWIRDIPGYEYVLIHIGNIPADTLGCILVGDVYSDKTPDKISQSEAAYRHIYPVISTALLNGESVTIEIINDK